MAKLTQKQEAFAQYVVMLGSKAEAYRQAYDTKAKPEVVQVAAYRESEKPHVALRIQEIKDELAEKELWKRIDSVKTLADIASHGEKDSDRIGAVKALNDMFGWSKQSIEHSGAIVVEDRKTLDDFYAEHEDSEEA